MACLLLCYVKMNFGGILTQKNIFVSMQFCLNAHGVFSQHFIFCVEL